MVLFVVYKDMKMAENRFREFLNNLAVLQGIDLERVNAIVNTYNQNEIYDILEKYGYSMLGVLIVIAENSLPIDFAKEVTPPDGNCYLHALQNQTKENQLVIPNLTLEHLHELNMDKKQLRKLWCQTGKGYFAGKWGSQINVKGNMSEKE